MSMRKCNVLQNVETKQYVSNNLYEAYFVSDIKEAMFFPPFKYSIDEFLISDGEDDTYKFFLEHLHENNIILEPKTIYICKKNN